VGAYEITINNAKKANVLAKRMEESELEYVRLEVQSVRKKPKCMHPQFKPKWKYSRECRIEEDEVIRGVPK
jgi:hypothetical protein